METRYYARFIENSLYVLENPLTTSMFTIVILTYCTETLSQ